MLTIKDLTASKELDSKAMTRVVGGSYDRVFGSSVSLYSPINSAAFGTQFSEALAVTGPIHSNTLQNDNDIMLNGAGGQQLNSGGNHSTTNIVSSASALDFQALVQNSF